MAEMLAVMAAPAAEDRTLIRRCFELCIRQHRADGRAIFILELARIGGDAAVDGCSQSVVDLEQLGDEAPAPIESIGHAPRAFLGAVAEADRPFACELAMISNFLDCLVRELDEKSIARTRQSLKQHVLPGRVKEM